jgi:hypothetical protein
VTSSRLIGADWLLNCLLTMTMWPSCTGNLLRTRAWPVCAGAAAGPAGRERTTRARSSALAPAPWMDAKASGGGQEEEEEEEEEDFCVWPAALRTVSTNCGDGGGMRGLRFEARSAGVGATFHTHGHSGVLQHHRLLGRQRHKGARGGRPAKGRDERGADCRVRGHRGRVGCRCLDREAATTEDCKEGARYGKRDEPGHARALREEPDEAAERGLPGRGGAPAGIGGGHSRKKMSATGGGKKNWNALRRGRVLPFNPPSGRQDGCVRVCVSVCCGGKRMGRCAWMECK